MVLQTTISMSSINNSKNNSSTSSSSSSSTGNSASLPTVHNNSSSENNHNSLEEQPFAVIVDSIRFGYSFAKPVLKSVSLHVPRAKIYALLGPNGCGKTTLLNILLGRRKPNTGCVHILGHSITSKRATKLNHFMGFMPQEIALDTSLTISETFHYFSKINHVRDASFVEERIRCYLQMLQLKDGDQLVGLLSGGQKRLLSLGVTLIYEPKILLLDEPTVGVDSMIREKIWSHLRQICELNKTSVIITTHYMEEAATSDTVGFIRGGEMLAEHCPKTLMSMLACDTLEEVFYRICIQQSQLHLSPEQKTRFLKYTKIYDNPNHHDCNNNNNYNNNNYNNNNNNNNSHARSKHKQCDNDNCEPEEPIIYQYEINENNVAASAASAAAAIEPEGRTRKVRLQSSPDIEIFARLDCAKSRLVCWEHLWALLYRELLIFRSNPNALLMFIFTPIIAITLFYTCYGRTPVNVPCALVNHDEGFLYNNEIFHISNRYFEKLSHICDYSHHSTVESAVQQVRLGHSVLAIAVSRNFSRAFLMRYNQWNRSSAAEPFTELDDNEYEQMIDDSEIKTFRDHSRVVTTRFLNVSLLRSLHETISILSHRLSIDPTMLASPLDMKEFVYGNFEINFQPTLIGGVLIISQIGLICMYAALKIVAAKQNGCLERDLNQSVSAFELNISFHIIPLFSIAIQTLLASSWTYFVLESPLNGSYLEAFGLLYLTNLQGLFIGSLISTYSTGPFASILCSFSVMVVFFFTSGTMWPIEGMRPRIQTIFKFNPVTLPTQAIRSIASRKWSLFTHWAVALPFITTALTSIGLFAVQSVAFAFTVRQK